MKQMFSFAAKAALAMLLMCVIMLFIVTPGSAEWVIMAPLGRDVVPEV